MPQGYGPYSQQLMAGGGQYAPQPGMAGPVPGQPVPHTNVKTNPNSTQNALQIAEIRDGIVIIPKNGTIPHGTVI